MIQIPEELGIEHLRKNFKKGDVLFYKNFEGKEKYRDSYFVLLTNCINDEFLVVRATKNIHYYNNPTNRLKHDIVLIKKGETTIFTLDTIIDLTWTRVFTINEMVKLLGTLIVKKGCLPTQIIARINESVLMAVTIEEKWQKIILECK